MSGEAADILLRKPQLSSALAAVESAKAAVASAEASLRAAQVRLSAARLDLERTTLVAPFNSVVVDRRVEVGDVLAPGTTVTRLVGSDVFWVRLAVPQADLPWIDFPEAPEEVGSSVRVFDDTAGPGAQARAGHVARRLPTVDEVGRMARVLVQVEDPLALEEEHADRWPLLAGSFVRAEIVGARLERVVVVPRRYVRGSDSAWIMNEEDRLEVRELDVLYRSRDEVFVRAGVNAGERLITTDLSAPVPGMTLRTE